MSTAFWSSQKFVPLMQGFPNSGKGWVRETLHSGVGRIGNITGGNFLTA